MGVKSAAGCGVSEAEILAVYACVSLHLQIRIPPVAHYNLSSLCVGITVFSVTAAVCILNITIYQLSTPPTTASTSTSAPATHDSPPSTNDYGRDTIFQAASTQPPAILSFAVLALSVVAVFAVLCMYVIGNGSRTLKRAFVGRTGRSESQDLRDRSIGPRVPSHLTWGKSRFKLYL
jgi:hypothetical protein